MSLSNIKVGDTILRIASGPIEVPLEVTDVTETEIVCGPWRFDRETGQEIEPSLTVENLTTQETRSLANVLRVTQMALNLIT